MMDEEERGTRKKEGRRGRNKAVYTAISVACGWAGAVMSLCKPRNSEIRDQKLDDTDGRTDGRTDIASYRVACILLVRPSIRELS